MSYKIENDGQFEKLITALDIFFDNDILRTSAQSPGGVTFNYVSGLVRGAIYGRLSERYDNGLDITHETIRDILEDIQQFSYGQNDNMAIAKIQGFMARMSEFVEEAFNIAIDDKELPNKIRQSNTSRLR